MMQKNSLSRTAASAAIHTLSDGNWRAKLALILIFAAALPVQVFAVPGFEVTPSLILAPVALILFRLKEPIHLAVVAFMAFCLALAMIGPVGGEGRIRNILGSASYSSGAPYIIVGMELARRGYSISKVFFPVLIVSFITVAIFSVDLLITGGNIVDSSNYESIAYQAVETTFVQSIFPFYGKYAVITLSTVVAVIAGFSLATFSPEGRKSTQIFTLVISGALLFFAFSMLSRQVMVGVVVFFGTLLVLSFRRKEAWITLAVFLGLLVPWAAFVGGSSGQNVTGEIGISKIVRGVENAENGNFDDLSTGRLPLYRDAVARLSPSILLGGCGFCNLVDVMDFPFSSLHNVLLTAVYKGGVLYAATYIGAAFLGLILIRSCKASFSRDVLTSVLVSIAVQSLINDVLYFQVVPALMFVLAGYVVSRNTFFQTNMSWTR
ncbi:hypothetical protein [Pelagibacterium sp.]|uniref:hypothetical protein n=1 Tax=Pelagibacterium sp. TaxID=1967288 RepID=UPI003A93EDAA